MKRRRVYDKEMAIRQILLMVLDGAAVAVSSVMALLLRFNLSFAEIQEPYLENVWHTLAPNVLTVLVVFWFFRLYHSVWRYAGMYELQQIILATVTVTVLQLFGSNLAGVRMPRSYWFLYAGVLICVTVMTRFSYRIMRRIKKRVIDSRRGVEVSRVMVVGAGAAADVLIRELKTSDHLHKHVECVIDDDASLKGRTIQGCYIVGGREVIIDAAAQYQIDEIIIAMPSAGKRTIAEIAKICNETGCELKTLPGVYQLVNKEVRISQLRHVEIEDLLGRDPVTVDLTSITGYLGGQVVLVTGGGGSIGSELCRQIAAAEPRQLIR